MSPATLVLLHGHGDDPAAFTRFAGDAAAALGPDTVVVVPIGPVDTGGGRRAWWATGDDEGPDGPDDPGQRVVTAVAVLDDALADLRRGTTDPDEPLVVGGFSQGAALVLTWLVDGGRTVAPDAVFALAGWIEHTSATGPEPAVADLPVLVAYGEDDEVVPPPASRSAGRFLERVGAAVTLTEVATGHTPVDAFLDSVRGWLGGLDGPA